MKINWEIKKKRGNFRPFLKYEIVLEPFEKKLAIHAVSVQSLIPEIPDSHQSFCLPGENERHTSWAPVSFHRLQVPYFKTGEAKGFIRLPFRADSDYPEVEASFRELRRVFEAEVCKAWGQAPFEQKGHLDISPATREQVAPHVAGERLLALFGRPGKEKTADGTAEPAGAFSGKLAV